MMGAKSLSLKIEDEIWLYLEPKEKRSRRKMIWSLCKIGKDERLKNYISVLTDLLTLLEVN